MLEVKNLSVSIGDREILKDFNLTVAERADHQRRWWLIGAGQPGRDGAETP